MMQQIITYIILGFTFGYTGYRTIRNVISLFGRKKLKYQCFACSADCSTCPFAKSQKEFDKQKKWKKVELNAPNNFKTYNTLR